MRRYVFYLAVALLAFGIGSFSANRFARNENEKIPKAGIQKIETEIKPVKIQEQKIVVSETEDDNSIVEEFFYGNPEKYLKPIIKRWLKGEKIEEKLLSARTFKAADSFSFDNFLPSLIDVNSDGRKELAIKYACSPTGNCEFLIFEKFGKSYRRILKAALDVQIFEFRKEASKNYKNIETRMHGSSDSGDGVIYRFNGKEYKPVKCFEYVYETFIDDYGQSVAKSTPTFKYFSCKF